MVAREWHAKQSATWVELHASRIMLRLENDVFPWLGRRPIADVTARELLATVNRIVDRGAVESAHCVLQNCGQVLCYAIVTGRADLLALADRLAVDRAHVHRLDDDLALLAAVGEGGMRALLLAAHDTATRQAGKVPSNDSAAILCHHCGPVYVHPAIAACLPVVFRSQDGRNTPRPSVA